MLALLPAVATIIGFLVLGQAPTGQDLAGIALVIIGVAIHHESAVRPPAEAAPPTDSRDGHDVCVDGCNLPGPDGCAVSAPSG